MSAETSPDSKKVFIVSESSQALINGVSGSVRKVAAHLALRNYEAEVVTPWPALPDKQLEGFRVRTTPSAVLDGFYIGLPTHEWMRRQVRKSKPNIVHVASPASKQGNAGIKAANANGVPSVSVYQTDIAQYVRRFTSNKIPKELAWLRKRTGDDFEQLLFQRIAMLHQNSTMTLVPSSAAWQHLEGISVDPDTMRMWGRGVDTDLYRPEWAETEEVNRLKNEWSQGGTRTIVGYVGRLAPEKTVERLAVLSGDPSIRLVIVGDGPSKAKLQSLLPKDTLFLGEQTGETLARSYAAFDLFVHPGNDETFGQAIQEGMASGVPVIVPDKGGPLDTVDEGLTGLFYDHRSDESLRERVVFLADRPALRRQMGATAARAMKGRSWEAIGDQLLGYYDEAIDRFTR